MSEITAMSFRFVIHLLLLVAPLKALEESRTVTLRSAALGIAGDRDIMWVRSPDGAVPLSLNTRAFSLPVKLRLTGKQLAIYLERKDAEAKEPPPPAITVNLAGDASLLVFLPDKDRYRAFAVPDEEVPRGSYALVNLSGLPLAWGLDGKAPLAVAPGGRAIHKAVPGASTAVKIAMKLSDGSLRLVRNTVWQMGADQREFVLVHGTPTRPGFHHLVDSVAEPAAP